MRPNVVLVHAGTNDMLSDELAANATKNMGDLIDEIVAACPDATVVIAQLIPNRVNSTEERLVVFNSEIPAVVAKRANAGKKVMYYNFFNKLDTATDYSDDTHPNDQGYEKMALGWYAAISQAYDNGWIKPPVNVSTRRDYNRMRPLA
jgi:lysophospholipase L1-like esterase